MSRIVGWLRPWPRPVVVLAGGAALVVLALLWIGSGRDAGRAAGAFALAGVLAGGLITGVTTWAFERRRDEADLRQARRLIAEELRTIYFHFEAAANEKRAPDTLDGFLPDKQWQARKEMLARHLVDAQWDALSPFMDTIGTSRRIIGRTTGGFALPPDVVTRTKAARDLARETYVLLTGTEPHDPV